MDEQGADLRHVVGLLRRQLGVIAVAVVAALAIALVALTSMPTLYTGTTLIMVDPARRALIEPEAQSTGAMSESWRVDSELEILKSDAVLLAVVLAEDLTTHPEFNRAGSSPQAAVAALRSVLSAQREGLTSVISVSVTSRDPETAAQLANGVAEAYIGMQSQEKAQSAIAASDVIDARLASARDAVTEARSALDAAIESQRPVPRRSLDLANLLAAERLASVDPEDASVVDADPPEVVAPAPALDGLETTLVAAELHFRTLIERQTALDLQSEFQLADSRIVSAALVPVTPSAPNRGVVLAVALLSGLGIGVGLAFAREAYVGGVTSGSQLAAATRRSVLSVIPEQKRDADHLARLIVDQPLSRYGEAIRRTRMGLDRAFAAAGDAADGPGRVVLVGSARHGEGKSLTALALGRSYALAGRKTLLIDCDVRNPSIHALLDGAGGQGASDALVPSAVPAALGAMLMADVETGMSVVVSTHPSEMASEELLSGADFSRLMAAAIENFDIVILDGPAVGESADALHLARFADAVLMVVRWAHTPQSEVRQALAQLADAVPPGASLVMVLNRARGHGAGSDNKQRLMRNGLRPLRRWGREVRSRQ